MIGQSSPFPILTLQPMNPKLIDDNYRYWRDQALLAIGAHDLEKQLTGLSRCPRPFLLVKSDDGTIEVKVANIMFSSMEKMDKLLMGWLISSLYGDLFSLVL